MQQKNYTNYRVTGHATLFLVTGQEVFLSLSGERHEPALRPLGVAWLEPLWKCRLQVIHGP